MTATEYWKRRFGKEPKTDSEKLAIAMMSDYGNQCLADVSKSLPADDEISQVASDEMQQDWNRLEYKNIYRDGFFEGAKWMRDKTGNVC